MLDRRKTPLAIAAALTVILAPGVADAATKPVTVGTPAGVKGLPEGADFNAYFPSTIKVAKGDSVSFEFRGFHTVTFSKKPPSLFTVNGKVSGATDAAGNPFWFNGADRGVLNGAAAAPSGDGKITGKGSDSSGLPEGEKPKPFKVSFTKTGTFGYVCLVHPDMKGSVTVQKKSRRKVPSKQADAARVAKQVARFVKTAKKLAAFKGPGGTSVRAGNDTKDVSMFKFFPEDVTVPVGQSVRWQMTRGKNEIHTITFGPQDYLKPIGESFVAPDPASPPDGPPTLVVNPLASYPSDPPTSPVSYDGANHGNGFLNSGILDDDSRSPFAKEFSATFTKPGTYGYLCLVHGPDMSGKVTVTP